jgi:hypothetical protein
MPPNSAASIAQRAVANARPPPPDGRRGSRPLRTPQYDSVHRRRNAPRSLSRILNAARLSDLAKLAAVRRPGDLANPRRLLEVVAHHYPTDAQLPDWLPLWTQQHFPCPAALVRKVIAAFAPHSYSGDELAVELEVKFAVRQRLKLWSFGSCDLTEQERRKLVALDKKAKDRERAAASRRAKGAMLRTDYEAASLSKTKPWLAVGMTERTWHRRRAQDKLAEVRSAPSC